MNISVAGIGYVGLSNAVLLSQRHHIITYDISQRRVDLINERKAPIVDKEAEEFLASKPLDLYATCDPQEAFVNAEYIIIATPTDYDISNGHFDTSSVEAVLNQISNINPGAVCVIKSTVPVGYTSSLRQKLGYANVIFSPEFLREGKALFDNLYPSRIIVGAYDELKPQAKTFANALLECSATQSAQILVMNPTEAEAVKLFANTYLAMRVAFFNELDTFADISGLDTLGIIQGVCLDPRIGNFYNNPSFGYGGYCLPKDTKQMLANYHGVPNDIIGAIVAANDTRKDYIAARIMAKNPATVGVHRLVMKSGSDNYRQSAIIGVIRRLIAKGINVVVYEPVVEDSMIFNAKVIKDLDEFKSVSDVIVCNRCGEELEDVKEKLYTRDVFGRD
ncbi:MAG: nucleotide sugar dehydrogenase [Clostridiales bacterium]|nr:nucleotide sugar dehydrogenase [Clostridiales bacterium]